MRAGRWFAIFGMVVLAMSSWGCPPKGGDESADKDKDKDKKEVGATAVGLMTFEDEGASWITAGNYFPRQERGTAPTWLGVLFQFGDFSDTDFKGKVRFTDADDNPVAIDPLVDGALEESQFTWINIVSDRGSIEEPILDSEVWVFFPNGIAHQCDIGSTGNDCLRDRRIHRDQREVSFIITYWQGDNGFTVDSKASAADGRVNAVNFHFLDNFKINVYKLNASNTMDPVVSMDAGTVSKIEITNLDDGPAHGGKHDPPWIQ